MKIQFNNKLLSTFMLTIDNAILSKGDAYTNTTSQLYPVSGSLNGLNAYTTPYRQLVNDASITGATQISGLYVNNTFTMPGQNGLISFNISEGLAYFTGMPVSVSGAYALKDFNIYLSDEPEEKILFETKYNLRASYPQTITGLAPNAQTYPVIFIKHVDTVNVPFCLGGIDNKKVHVRAIVLAQSQYQLSAACNILEDLAHKKQPIFNPITLPFDALGGFSGVSYNYETAKSAVTDFTYIQEAKTSMLFSVRELNILNPSIFPAFVDFELWNFLSL